MPTSQTNPTTAKPGKKARATKSSRGTRSSTATRKRGGVDALKLLRDDHRDVERLFKKFEKTGPTAYKTRESVVGKVIRALAVHAAIEEQILYPETRERVPTADSDILEALEEHHVVKWTLSELQDMSPEDERYEAKMTVLMESVRHHVEEEETELFPLIREAFGRTELREMGARLLAAKTTAPTRPHPRSPDTPPGNLVAGAISAPLDAAAGLADTAARKVRELTS